MIYISKELYLYISYVIKKKKIEKKLKTATGKLYVQNAQTMRGLLSIIGGRGNNHKAQELS